MYDTIYAYLAGTMDSDGSFCIYKYLGKKDCVNPVYVERAQMGQATPDVVVLLQEMFGGGIYIASQNNSSFGNTRMYLWTCAARIAVQCAKILLPYLIIKRERAQLLIEMAETRQRSTWLDKSGHSTPPSIMAKREAIYLSLRALNLPPSHKIS